MLLNTKIELYQQDSKIKEGEKELVIETRIDHVDQFFSRNRFDLDMRHRCISFAEARYPGCSISAVQTQGYCSYTLMISSTILIQFRPELYRLDVDACDEARAIYQDLVPKTQHIDVIVGNALPSRNKDMTTIGPLRLHVYSQDRIHGVSWQELLRSNDLSPDMRRFYRQRLVSDLARVFATGFQRGRCGSEEVRKGNVGCSLRRRLNILGNLQSKRQRQVVVDVTKAFAAIEELCWCFTHGDLVPANIMVDPGSGHLTGLVDWAEGEWLPFGVGLYGLEEVLGYEDSERGFVYYDDHAELRQSFWQEFLDRIQAEGKLDVLDVKTLELSKKLGILLWRGIAFDDGRINRAVEIGRDDAELHKLELFLEADSSIPVLGSLRNLDESCRDSIRGLGRVQIMYESSCKIGGVAASDV